THPILRYVSLDYVYVAESLSVTLPAQAEVLAEGPQGPVLFRYAAEGRQYLVLTFAVENSTWWSKLSFGVFAYNAIRYLGGGDSESDGSGTSGQAAVGGASAAPGTIQSRDDCRRALDRVCEYLERHEPSNPASLFARRAQRMLNMQFLDIMRELSPEAISHLEMLTGARPPDS
ncbi:MAG TPA: hypothetical protein PLP17_16255, partial [Oligoflexia bacterium]|nr:hypothetical protein [Oligoflexia bacterium]